MQTTTTPSGIGLGPAAGLGARVRRLVGDRSDAWVRPALAGVLVLTAVLYVWDLGRNGNANSYYSAAVLAGTQSWKALFFGAFDAGSFITVDKPPAALWLMELSGRIFGFNSWSMLLPEALLGVASVGLLFATVRRAAGPVAGLVAAIVMALTPVAVLMFRFNNPDALLTFLLVASAWAMIRAVESGRTRWLLLSAAIVGLAFLTKYLQAYIVLPSLVATYLLLGPGAVARRFVQLLAAAGALVVSSGWWVAVVWSSATSGSAGSPARWVGSGVARRGRLPAAAVAAEPVGPVAAAASAVSPGCCGSSTRPSAARSAGSCRWPSRRSRSASGRTGGGRGPTWRSRACCCGAGGC